MCFPAGDTMKKVPQGFIVLSNRFCDLFKMDGAVFFLLNEMAHKELDQLCNPIQPPAFFQLSKHIWG